MTWSPDRGDQSNGTHGDQMQSDHSSKQSLASDPQRKSSHHPETALEELNPTPWRWQPLGSNEATTSDEHAEQDRHHGGELSAVGAWPSPCVVRQRERSGAHDKPPVIQS